MRSSSSSVRPHRPALITVLLFGAGIAVDRTLQIPLGFWLFLAVVVLAGLCISWFSRLQSGRVQSLLILALVFLSGGARHHSCWFDVAPDDVSRICSDTPVAVAVQGVVSREIEIHDRPVGPRIPPWMEIDRSVGLLKVLSLRMNGELVPCSGQVRLDVTGHLVDVEVGSRVEVLGQLSRPGKPSNPGESSFEDVLRMQGATANLRVTHPAAVRVLGRESGWIWVLAGWREKLRRECQRLLSAELRPPLNGLASSLLIGDRSRLTDELRGQFAVTGMMHLVAISGINVGIILGMLYGVGRIFNFPFRPLAVTMVCAALIFTWVTDQQPSVIRAGLLAAMGLISGLANRQSDRWNLLAGCALILLVWRPSDLFDIGAQLSFLAVAAIFWSTEISLRAILHNSNAIPGESGFLVNQLKRWGWVFLQMYFITSAIWLATVPITMATFHLLTPIGLILDLILVPVASVVLASGYLFLIVGLLSPWLGSWIAIPFHWGLQLMQSIIAWGKEVPFGHFYVPTVPAWWLWGFYLLLAWNWLGPQNRRSRDGSPSNTNILLDSSAEPKSSPRTRYLTWKPRSQLSVALMFLWIAGGLIVPFLPTREGPLRCTFLSVGHGLACVVEFPNREVLLYDAGTMGDGRRAQRAVENFLWQRGIRTIDSIIVSHADHDHFSGLFGLMERFPVRQVLMSVPSARSKQSGMRELLNATTSHGIPISLIQQGDKLQVGGVNCEVRSPPRSSISERESSVSDNELSVVLLLSYQNRRILLTGDLEGEGLKSFLSENPPHAEILLSPHHGAAAGNPPELYRAVDPSWVVVSAGRGGSIRRIEGDFQLLETAQSGAITFEIDRQGIITHEVFLEPIHKGLAFGDD